MGMDIKVYPRRVEFEWWQPLACPRSWSLVDHPDSSSTVPT